MYVLRRSPLFSLMTRVDVFTSLAGADGPRVTVHITTRATFKTGAQPPGDYTSEYSGKLTSENST